MVDTPHGSASASFAGRPPASGARPARSWARWALRVGVPAHGIGDLSRARRWSRSTGWAWRRSRCSSPGSSFAAVAARYAEGVSLFPEAGGSAALARHAFDELASFVTGWADDAWRWSRRAALCGAVCGAVSERLLGPARDPAGGPLAGGARRHRARGGGEHPRPRALGEPGGVRWRSRPRSSSSCSCCSGAALRLPARARSSRTCTSARRRSLEQLILACAACDGRLHGHRDDRRHGGRGARPRPRPGRGVGAACSRRPSR